MLVQIYGYKTKSRATVLKLHLGVQIVALDSEIRKYGRYSNATMFLIPDYNGIYHFQNPTTYLDRLAEITEEKLNSVREELSKKTHLVEIKEVS